LGLLGVCLGGGGFFAGGGCVLYGLVTLLAQGVRFALQGFGLCNGFGGEGQVVWGFAVGHAFVSALAQCVVAVLGSGFTVG